MVDIGFLTAAFSAGIVSFFNPCSFALLPAYLSYFLGREEEDISRTNSLLRGLKFGGLASAGFVTFFGGIGVGVALVGSQIKNIFTQLLPLIGLVLVILGIFWVLGRQVLYMEKLSNAVSFSRSSFFLFGIAYGLSSLACVFPVFLMLTFTSIEAGGILSGFSVFLVFSIAMSIMLVSVSLAVSLSKYYILEKLKGVEKYVTKISGLILIGVGLYFIFYYFF